MTEPPYRNAIETIHLLDRLGYDEAWIGEHHSAGAYLMMDHEWANPVA